MPEVRNPGATGVMVRAVVVVALAVALAGGAAAAGVGLGAPDTGAETGGSATNLRG